MKRYSKSEIKSFLTSRTPSSPEPSSPPHSIPNDPQTLTTFTNKQLVEHLLSKDKIFLHGEATSRSIKIPTTRNYSFHFIVYTFLSFVNILSCFFYLLIPPKFPPGFFIAIFALIFCLIGSIVTFPKK